MRVSKLHVNPKQRTNLAAIAARCFPLHVYSKRDPLGREMKVKDAQPLKREYIFGLDGGGSDLTPRKRMANYFWNREQERT